MLTITDLTVATDFPLLEHANLNLEKGKIIGLSAPNGTGKSTLLRTIAGLRNEKTAAHRCQKTVDHCRFTKPSENFFILKHRLGLIPI